MSLFKEKLELKIEEAELTTQQTLNSFTPVVKWVFILCIFGLVPSYFIAKNISFAYWNNKLKPLQTVAKTSFENPQALILGQVNLIGYADGTFGAVAKITNPNQNIAASQVNYSWHFYNQNGQEVQAAVNDPGNGKNFVLPAQTKYFVLPKISPTETIVQAVLNIDLANIKWQKRQSLPQVQLIAGSANENQQINPAVFSVDSSVLNNSPYQIAQIKLNFLVYDTDGKLRAISQRAENDLLPYEHRAFKQLWPGLFLNNTKVIVLPETNTLDPNNLKLPASSSSSSDLSHPPDR